MFGVLQNNVIVVLCYVILYYILHFGDRQTDKQTGKQMDNSDALSRSRCRERWLNKAMIVGPKCCELVKLCHINYRVRVFETQCMSYTIVNIIVLHGGPISEATMTAHH